MRRLGEEVMRRLGDEEFISLEVTNQQINKSTNQLSHCEERRRAD